MAREINKSTRKYFNSTENSILLQKHFNPMPISFSQKNIKVDLRIRWFYLERNNYYIVGRCMGDQWIGLWAGMWVDL